MTLAAIPKTEIKIQLGDILLNFVEIKESDRIQITLTDTFIQENRTETKVFNTRLAFKIIQDFLEFDVPGPFFTDNFPFWGP